MQEKAEGSPKAKRARIEEVGSSSDLVQQAREKFLTDEVEYFGRGQHIVKRAAQKEDMEQAQEWFEGEGVVSHVCKKIDNIQYWGRGATLGDYRHNEYLQGQLKELRQWYKEQNEIESPYDDEGKPQSIIRERVQEVRNAISSAIESSQREVDAFIDESKGGAIVWATPAQCVRGDKSVDEVFYGSKSPEKVVYKPFSAIHHSLANANWAVRQGNMTSANHLTVHLLFTVSTEPHYRSSAENKSESREGVRRTYIDFPLMAPMKFFWEKGASESATDYLTRTPVSLSERFIIPEMERGHSERALEEFLTKQENIYNIVHALSHEMTRTFGTSEGHKVYEVNIFVNSQKNVCNQEYPGALCEERLKKLQTSREEDSFLHLLKQEIESHNMLNPTREGFPRALISVSAHQYYGHGSSRLTGDAQEGLESPPTKKYSIDTKELAGKVILSTREKDVYQGGKYADSSNDDYQDIHSDRLKKVGYYKEVPTHVALVSRSGERWAGEPHCFHR